MSLDKSQTIALLLVGALAVNTVVHFTSPAYRFYKDQFKMAESRLNGQYDLFASTVRTNVTDAVVDFYTNVLAMVERRPSFSATNSLGVVSSPSSFSPILPLVDNISYSYCYVDGVDIATIGTQHYKVGQVFPRGGLITSVSSDCIVLDGRYRVANTSNKIDVKRKDVSNE